MHGCLEYHSESSDSVTKVLTGSIEPWSVREREASLTGRHIQSGCALNMHRKTD